MVRLVSYGSLLALASTTTAQQWGYIKSEVYADAACSSDVIKTTSFPTNACLNGTDAWFNTYCSADGASFTQRVYSGADSCTGNCGIYHFSTGSCTFSTTGYVKPTCSGTPAGLTEVSSESHELALRSAFADFKARFRSDGYADTREEAARLAIFATNLAEITEHNAKGLSYQLGVNQFSDLTQEEFLAQSSDQGRPDVTKAPVWTPSVQELPASVDWTSVGAVTPVQDQGSCGSCWAFEATGVLEGAWFVATGQLVSISEQQFLSCKGRTCNGGLAYVGIDWAKDQDLCTEDSFPYGPYPGTKPLPPMPACATEGCDVAVPAGTITGHQIVGPNNEALMLAAVAQQPVGVSIEEEGLSQYHTGIISGKCLQARTNHAVLVVGYGTEDGKDYWKVKNSYGTYFGEAGYFRVMRNDPACDSAGAIGIASAPLLPILTNVPSPSPSPPTPPTPVPTPTPTPVPSPVPTPVPTPTPSPVPTPVPTPGPIEGKCYLVTGGESSCLGTTQGGKTCAWCGMFGCQSPGTACAPQIVQV